jgi:hypothetical protein
MSTSTGAPAALARSLGAMLPTNGGAMMPSAPAAPTQAVAIVMNLRFSTSTALVSKESGLLVMGVASAAAALVAVERGLRGFLSLGFSDIVSSKTALLRQIFRWFQKTWIIQDTRRKSQTLYNKQLIYIN